MKDHIGTTAKPRWALATTLPFASPQRRPRTGLCRLLGGNMNGKAPALALGLTVGLAWLLSTGTAFAQSPPGGASAARQHLLTVRLSGGADFPSIGGLNTILESAYNGYKDSSDTLEGGVTKLGRGTDLSADVTLHVTPRFGIMLGGAVTSGIKGRVSIRATSGSAANGWSSDLVFDDRVRVIPLRLGAQLSVPIARRLEANVLAGLGYYHARWQRTSEGTFAMYNDAPEFPYSLTSDGTGESNLTGNTLGFHGGAGLEYRLTSRLGVFVEGAYQYAKVKPMKGDYGFESQSTWVGDQGIMPGSYSQEGPGTAYVYEEQAYADGPWMPALDISRERPEQRSTSDAGAGRRAIEELGLDLSGASLKIGFSFSF